MLSATSSANAYATFNPVALNPSYGFMDSRFTTDMPSANDEYVDYEEFLLVILFFSTELTV